MNRSVEPTALIPPPTPGEFERIAKLLYREAGIVLAPGKTSMVQARLAKRMRSLGLYDFSSYLALLERGGDKQERQFFISALTTNVTQFFREGHHFDMLRKTVLPPLLDRARAGGRLRIWSAGCSNGQEPYSIAMTLLSMEPNAAKLDIRMLATDIDQRVLEYARRGEYTVAEAAGLSDPLRRVFTSVEDGKVRINDAVKRLMAFQQLNLHDPWPALGRFDIIFCRNVVIYFDAAAQAELWWRFEQALNPGGWIFVGHSERIVRHPQSALSTAGITAYRHDANTPGRDT